MARRNIILTTLSITRTRYPSGANLLVSRPWNDVIIITSWEWIMTLSGGPDCVHDYHVVTSNGWWRQKIFKIKYFDGLNFVLAMNDPDNSSKITFVWPLFYHYNTFLYWISTWHITFDRKKCSTKSWDLIHKLVSLNRSMVYCNLHILLNWTKMCTLHCAQH